MSIKKLKVMIRKPAISVSIKEMSPEYAFSKAIENPYIKKLNEEELEAEILTKIDRAFAHHLRR